MGHTNSTANLALPQFIGTDKPTWLSDVNGAFAAIDTYAGTNDAALAITDAKADTAVNDAASAVTTATNAANTAGTASTQATNAVTVAGNALTVANGINSKVGVLTDLTTTDKSSVVNAINEVDANSKYQVIASATVNTSYASQLAEIEAAYNALTSEQKARCAIVRQSFSIHRYDGNGTFTRVVTDATDLRVQSLDITNHTYYTNTNGTIVNQSANPNVGGLDLVLM